MVEVAPSCVIWRGECRDGGSCRKGIRQITERFLSVMKGIEMPVKNYVHRSLEPLTMKDKSVSGGREVTEYVMEDVDNFGVEFCR